MKLLLTSSGLDKPALIAAVKKSIADPKTCRAAIVTSGVTPESIPWLALIEDQLAEAGITNTAIVNLSNGNGAAALDDAGLIFVCGGNTFSILAALREHGWVEKIQARVKAGALYIGVSAGSILASGSIELAGFGSEGDENEIALEDLTGFGFTNIAVFPHFKPSLAAEVDEFSQQVDYPVIAIADGQAVFALGDSHEVL
ncbi:MAG: Type 1 glutamine amidotransferase-like domain-containing protein [bacterium]